MKQSLECNERKMHELSLCINIIKILEAQAKVRGFKRIYTVWIEIGELVAVEIEAIKFNFYLAIKSTVAQDAKLKIITTPGLAYCKLCKKEFHLKKYAYPCQQCQGYEYQVIGGKELLVKKMEAE